VVLPLRGCPLFLRFIILTSIANVISLSEACGYGLIMVGGTVIIITIAEDIGTLGLGTFDDAITVPAGILFINWGQRLAVLVPVTAP
jgi:hypothetical protein